MSYRRALGAMVVGSLLLRLVLLVLRGDYIVYDEGYYLLLARSLREHGAFLLNGLPHVSLSPMQPVLVAALSLSGLNDVWASRLLGAVCGALLVLPVAALARRAGGPRAGLAAALFTALAPALLTYLPFFPGRVWNLYFGSEPLFLLAAFTACAAAAGAFEQDTPGWFLLGGAACGAAFLARGEGIVLGPLVMLLLAAMLAWRRAGRITWRRWALGVLVAAALAAPYLLYLRSALGRWAFSGRVQAMATAGAAPAPGAAATARRGGNVLDDFVWGGDEARFRAELYRLTPDGTRLQSQYWGVDRTPPDSAFRPQPVTADTVRATSDVAGPAPRASFARTLLRGVLVVTPWWMLLVALAGFALSWRSARELAWLSPVFLAALVPAFAAYVEPRSLLPLAPLATIGMGLAWAQLRNAIERRPRLPAWTAGLALGALVVALLLPTARAGVLAWRNDTPLQQVAAAQRAVGAYLSDRLPAGATVMSWHPGPAIHARRDWRVMPEEPLERLLRYAQSRGVRAIVLSRFHPTPLADPPRAFTVVLLDDSSDVSVPGTLRLEQVDDTPLLFVGRLPGRRP